MLSTLPGKHGKPRNDTEVPRKPLLKALESESDLRNTNNPKHLKSGELSVMMEV